MNGINYKTLFKSQDSRYYLQTAFKLTLIPVVSLLLVIYSLWLFLNMNYAFFVSNGMLKGSELKSVFFEYVLGGVSDYFLWAMFFIFGMFLLGLLLSYFILRPFDQIKKFVSHFKNDNNQKFEVEKISQKKLVVQSASLLFDYMRSVIFGNSGDDVDIPRDWLLIDKPQRDLVFYFQYTCFLVIIFSITAFGLYLFTVSLHEEMVKIALTLLKVTPGIVNYFATESEILFYVFIISIGLNFIALISVSRSLIEQVDGVTFGFFRDIREILQGNHKKRIVPRYKDPGQDAASAVNQLLDDLLKPEEVRINEDVKQILQKEPLPPTYKGESGVSPAGSKFYEIITPKGYKIDKLTHQELVKILQEIEK